jgi:hypothetical protein
MFIPLIMGNLWDGEMLAEISLGESKPSTDTPVGQVE